MDTSRAKAQATGSPPIDCQARCSSRSKVEPSARTARPVQVCGVPSEHRTAAPRRAGSEPRTGSRPRCRRARARHRTERRRRGWQRRRGRTGQPRRGRRDSGSACAKRRKAQGWRSREEVLCRRSCPQPVLSLLMRRPGADLHAPVCRLAHSTDRRLTKRCAEAGERVGGIRGTPEATRPGQPCVHPASSPVTALATRGEGKCAPHGVKESLLRDRGCVLFARPAGCGLLAPSQRGNRPGTP